MKYSLALIRDCLPGQVLEENKLKEIKNGRLAMLAFVGFIAQHSATGKVGIT